jgi:hypothetical protein
MDPRLTEALGQLSADEIVEWKQIFDRLTAQAYRTDLWAAAYLMNGGASDDGFYYFRCWLIGMGKEIFEAAMANPDSLALVVDPKCLAQGADAEAEIYRAAHRAWMRVTGNTDTADYPERCETVQLIGDEWDFDDRKMMRQHLPRLTELYDE